MSTSIRWRVMVLQGLAAVVLVFGAGFAYWVGSFTHTMIRDQLTVQKIYFPAAGSEALSPSKFPDLQQYGGQLVDNGDKAKAYANGFIGRHLQSIANGKTYAEVSTLSLANPTDQKLAGQVQTLFRGETLRGLLLNAYGWWTVGTYALYAAIGLALAAIAVVGAFLFELVEALKRRKVTIGAKAKAPLPTSA